MGTDIHDVLNHKHKNASEMDTCQHASCVKRRAGLCGFVGCSFPASWQLVCIAELVTVNADSAGEDSIARGAPAADAKIHAVKLSRVIIELACGVHVDQLLAGAQLVLLDVTAERLGPEAHGERRSR